MNKLKKKNLYLEINNDSFLVAFGEHDDELNFKIVNHELYSPSGFKNGRLINLTTTIESLKKIIKKIENKSNILFSEVNVIINQNDFDCINVSGFKKLNGNQILSDDISYILNDVKSKLLESEKDKKIIHLFNTKYLLDNKQIKNLPIGLHGDFYSHQLTFFLMKNNELKDLKTLFNKCNLDINKIILKSFSDGIEIINKYKNDTFVNIKVGKDETTLSFFFESAFCFSQKFNFGSDIILKDISKVCSLEISTIQNIIKDYSFKISDQNLYVDKKYFDKKNFRKISLQHIIEISSARIEEITNIIFNKNKSLYELYDKEVSLYLNFEDKNILHKFQNIFENNLKKCKLKFLSEKDKDPLESIKIFGQLLSKGWAKEAIPVINKKRSLISRIFSGFFG